jgi:hypothetical protein
MEIQKDFKELLSLLNNREVEYIIVGAYALAFHGSPRYTGDIDIYVNPVEENAVKILAVLNDFGFGSLKLNVDDFTEPGNVIQLGLPPVRVDILTSISGVTWDEAYNGKVKDHYGDIEIWYLGREQYIANKKATGRLKDLADIESIEGI